MKDVRRVQRKEVLHLSIYNYKGEPVCNLYDNTADVSGQAANVFITTERNGWKELSFDIPSTCITAEGEEENYRLKYLIAEYKIKAVTEDETDWYIISEPKITRNAFSKSVSVRAGHVSQLLKHKNLDLEFSDEEGNSVGTAEVLLDAILDGTDWHRGNVGIKKKYLGKWVWGTFLEEDGKTAKKRTLTAQAGTGALGLIEKLCDLFEAKPVYHGEGTWYDKDDEGKQNPHTGYVVDILPMNPFAKIQPEQIPSQVLKDELDVMELYYDRNVHDLTKTSNTDNMATRLYAYGNSGDMNGACTLQIAEHDEWRYTVPSIAEEYKFNIQTAQEPLYYYFSGDVSQGDTLVWSNMDITSQSYIYDETKAYAYRVYKKQKTQNPTELSLIDGYPIKVKNGFAYLLGLKYYDDVGLMTEKQFQDIAMFQRTMPAKYKTISDAQTNFTKGEAYLSKLANYGSGMLKLDIASISNNMVYINTNSDNHGVVYRTDYDKAERRWFKWHITPAIKDKFGTPLTGTPSVLFIIHPPKHNQQGELIQPATYESAYLKTIWHMQDGGEAAIVVDEKNNPCDFEYSEGDYPCKFELWNGVRFDVTAEEEKDRDRAYLFCSNSMTGLLGADFVAVEALAEELDEASHQNPVVFFNADINNVPPEVQDGFDYQWKYDYHYTGPGTLYFSWTKRYSDENHWIKVYISDVDPTEAPENNEGYHFNTRRVGLFRWSNSDNAWEKITDKDSMVTDFPTIIMLCRSHDEYFQGLYEYYFYGDSLDAGNYAIFDGYKGYWRFKLTDKIEKVTVEKPDRIIDVGPNLLLDYSNYQGSVFTNVETDEHGVVIDEDTGKPICHGPLTVKGKYISTDSVIYPVENILIDKILSPGTINEKGIDKLTEADRYRTSYIPVGENILHVEDMTATVTTLQPYVFSANFLSGVTTATLNYIYDISRINKETQEVYHETHTGAVSSNDVMCYPQAEYNTLSFKIAACPDNVKAKALSDKNSYLDNIDDYEDDIRDKKERIDSDSVDSLEKDTLRHEISELEKKIADCRILINECDVIMEKREFNTTLTITNVNPSTIANPAIYANLINYTYSLPAGSAIHFYKYDATQIKEEDRYIHTDRVEFSSMAGAFSAAGNDYMRLVVPSLPGNNQYIKLIYYDMVTEKTSENLLDDRPFVFGSIDNNGKDLNVDSYKTYNIPVYENTPYDFDLPSGVTAILHFYTESSKYLGQEKSKEISGNGTFETPADAYYVRIVTKVSNFNGWNIHVQNYNKKFYCDSKTCYTILDDIETYGELIGITPLITKFADVSDITFDSYLKTLLQTQAEIKEAEDALAIELGDMLKDGRWQDSNYAGPTATTDGDVPRLYNDALYMLRQICVPEVTYSFTYLEMFGNKNESYYEEHEVEWPRVDISQVAHLVDMESNTNCWAYIDKTGKCYDQIWRTTVEIDTKLTLAARHGFTDVIARIAEVAKEMKAKQSLYDAAATGSVNASRLEGVIDLNQTYLNGGSSNWTNDEKGNLVFESADGLSAVQIGGRGIGISTTKNADGTWQWRTAATGYGLTADVITTGTLDAERIAARTITVDHLASNVGKELEISSNEALMLFATEDGSRPAGALKTTDGYIEVVAGHNTEPAKINIVSGGELNLNGGAVNVYSEGEMNVTSGGRFVLKSQGAESIDSDKPGLFIDSERGVNFAGGRFKVESYGNTMSVDIKADKLQLGDDENACITMDAFNQTIDINALKDITINSGATIKLEANKTLQLLTEGLIEIGRIKKVKDAQGNDKIINYTFTIGADEKGGKEGNEERAFIYYKLPHYLANLAGDVTKGLYIGTDGFALKQLTQVNGKQVVTSLTAADGKVSLVAGSDDTDNPDYVAVSVDGDYRIWAGHPYPETAPFSVKKDGEIYANNGTIGGFTMTGTQFHTINSTIGFVRNNNTKLYYKPDDNYPSNIEVSANTYLRVTEISNDWYKICNSDRQEEKNYLHKYVKKADLNTNTQQDATTGYVAIDNNVMLTIPYAPYMPNPSEEGADPNDYIQPYAIWSGAIEANEAPFSIKKDGTLWAIRGRIGGFSMNATDFWAGKDNSWVQINTDLSTILDSDGHTILKQPYGIWFGNETAVNAPFAVKKDGWMYSVKGKIGGFTMHDNRFYAGEGSSYIELNTNVNIEDTYAFWVGDETAKNAPFSVSRTGTMYARGATIELQGSGKFDVRHYDNNHKMWIHDFYVNSSGDLTIGQYQIGYSETALGNDAIYIEHNTGKMWMGNGFAIDPNDIAGPWPVGQRNPNRNDSFAQINCGPGPWRFAAGSGTQGTEPFRVHQNGTVYAKSIDMSDAYTITSFVGGDGGSISGYKRGGTTQTGNFHNSAWVGVDVDGATVYGAYNGKRNSSASVTFSLNPSTNKYCSPDDLITINLNNGTKDVASVTVIGDKGSYYSEKEYDDAIVAQAKESTRIGWNGCIAAAKPAASSTTSVTHWIAETISGVGTIYTSVGSGWIKASGLYTLPDPIPAD